MKQAHPVPGKGGFTLVELLVSMAILTLLMVMLVKMTDATRRTWSYTTSKVEQFRGAREAFEAVNRRLSQATLNTYWDYDDPLLPKTYRRQSELRFISGNSTLLTSSTNSPTHAIFFQAPLGYVTDKTSYSKLENLLNTWGYFVEFGSDKLSRPGFINTMSNAPAERFRFRLMEMMEPSDSLTLYKYSNGKSIYPGTNSYTATTWFKDPLGLSPRPVRAIAENIVALIILPKLSPEDQVAGGYTDSSLVKRSDGSPDNYLYDSTGTSMTTATDNNLNPKNQLPPVIQITMVALDETSFNRYQTGASMPDFQISTLFKTADDYVKDLQTLQKNLQANKLTYRVFTTNVSIKSAKWSRAQKN